LNGKQDKKFLKEKGVELKYSPEVLCSKIGDTLTAANVETLSSEELGGFLLKNGGYDFGCSFSSTSVAIDFKTFNRYLERVDTSKFLMDAGRLADFIIKVC